MKGHSVFRGFVPVLSALLLGLACHAIADVPDVTYYPECEDYCAEVGQFCDGATGFIQYPSKGACFKACEIIGAPNFANDAQGNTVLCRTDQAGNVANAPEDRGEFCSNAGPGGGRRCTTARTPHCEGYCSLFLGACQGASINPFRGHASGIPDVDRVTGLADCIESCEAVPPIPGGEYAFDTSTTGDTLGCRLHWATLATLEPNEQNCIRAGIRPQGQCVSPTNCANYCRATRVACGSYFDADEQHCLDVCAATSLGAGEAEALVGPDTITCRETHAFVALLVDDFHCLHAGILGAGVCGDNCSAYCRLAKTACSSDYEATHGVGQSADEACVEACKESEGQPSHTPADYTVEGAKSGDSVQCRALHASRALRAGLATAEKTRLCAAAFGGDPCR